MDALVAALVFASGLGGWRNGPLAAAGVLVPTAALTAWLATRGTAGRALWVLTAAVIGLVTAGACVDAAPWSHGRLAAELDRPRLDFYEVLQEDRAGSSWCRLTGRACPSVTRVYRAPYTSEFGTVVVVANSLRSAGMLELPNGVRLPQRLDVRQVRRDYVVIAQTTTVADPGDGSSPFRVRLHLAATT